MKIKRTKGSDYVAFGTDKKNIFMRFYWGDVPAGWSGRHASAFLGPFYFSTEIESQNRHSPARTYTFLVLVKNLQIKLTF